MPDIHQRTPLNCLVVEDDRADFALTRRAIDQAGIACRLDRVSDGLDLLETLNNSCALPDLILLDLNMPRLDGRETLTRLQRHPNWRGIPVVVLTTSGNEDDVRFCYAAGANCYVVKSADYHRFKHDMARLLAFWDRLAQAAATPDLE